MNNSNWWLVWLQDRTEYGAQTMDPTDLECAIVVNANDAALAEKLARLSASAVDKWTGGEEITPESYVLLRIAPALVGESA